MHIHDTQHPSIAQDWLDRIFVSVEFATACHRPDCKTTLRGRGRDKVASDASPKSEAELGAFNDLNLIIVSCYR